LLSTAVANEHNGLSIRLSIQCVYARALQALAPAAAAATAEDSPDDLLVAVYMGSVLRTAAEGERALRVRYHPSGTLLAVQGAGTAVEVLRIRTAAEAAKKRKRRLRRHREKAEKKAAVAATVGTDGDAPQEEGAVEAGSSSGSASAKEAAGGEASAELIAGDEVEAAAVLRTKHKVS
jgi:hypothetical protein